MHILDTTHEGNKSDTQDTMHLTLLMKETRVTKRTLSMPVSMPDTMQQKMTWDREEKQNILTNTRTTLSI